MQILLVFVCLLLLKFREVLASSFSLSSLHLCFLDNGLLFHYATVLSSFSIPFWSYSMGNKKKRRMINMFPQHTSVYFIFHDSVTSVGCSAASGLIASKFFCFLMPVLDIFLPHLVLYS